MHPKISQIVCLIRQTIPQAYIKIYTNGDIKKQLPEVDEINISIVHYNTKINDSFMNSRQKPTDLTEKLKFFRKTHPKQKIRLSIPLIKGAIDSPAELAKMIELTEKYVDQYVVRTLYPNSPVSKDNFVDFNYSHPKVLFERDNNIGDFDGVILWSDNQFYTDWTLTQKRNLEAYVLLKPDASTYLPEISSIINQHGFEVKQILMTNKLTEFALGLYQGRPPAYLALIKKHLENLNYLFGNRALILILDKQVPYQKLIDEIFDLKHEVRSKFSLTHAHDGRIIVGDTTSDLNLIHCPDPEAKFFNQDLNYIANAKLKVISDDRFEKMKQSRSFFG